MNKFLAKSILFLDRILNFYLYYVVMACFLSLVPNINPDYPLFHAIFTGAGFYIFPPVFGISFSCMIVMMGCALASVGLKKLYIKHFLPKDAKIVVLTKDEFERQFMNNDKEDNQNGDN